MTKKKSYPVYAHRFEVHVTGDVPETVGEFRTLKSARLVAMQYGDRLRVPVEVYDNATKTLRTYNAERNLPWMMVRADGRCAAYR